MAEALAIKDSLLVRHWWVQLIRGILIILFGIIAIVWPIRTLEALILIFGIFALVFGVAALIFSIFAKERWWALLIQGLVGIAIGLIALFMPDVTVVFVMFIIAIWAIIMGLLELASAIKLRKVITDDWLLVLAGILSILFGLIIFLWVEVALLAVMLFIGFYAILLGVILIILSIRLKDLQKKA
jgi:uncharacterized membrane protein HdeD (DUF308 family)